MAGHGERAWTLGLVAAAVALASAATAEDAKAPPAPKETVELKLAAKAGDALRFRHVESSLTQVNGKTYSGHDFVHEYTLTVKAVRADGGLEAELRYDLVQGKLASRIGGAPYEFDSSKPAAETADPGSKILSSLALALTKKPLGVTLDAHGAVTAVRGLRESWTEALAGTPFEKSFDPAKDFSDAKCVEEVAPLFSASPEAPHVVGIAWTADATDRIDGQSMDFGAKFAVSLADAEKAVVAAKFDWKPGAEATAGGAKAAGGGSVAATFSRRDGFLLSLSKNLKAARDTGVMKADSRTTHTIERLSAPPSAPKAKTK
jgi:hypothetical protein